VSLRQHSSLTIVAIAFAVLACSGTFHSAIPNIQAQEATTNAGVASKPSLQDRIEILKIRLAIRLQEVQVAKTERRLIARGTDNAAELLEAAEDKLLASLKERQDEESVDKVRIQAVESARRAAKNALVNYEENLSANADKLAVHDETIKLLELRAELTRTKLNQLQRRLNR